MNAREVACLTGVSVRTLHHYDELGLLCPRRNEENGYRVFSETDLDRLQQILFFRACGFSLSRIRELLDSPNLDRDGVFALQRKLLLHERARIDAMLDTLEKTAKYQKGEITMTNQEKFQGFDFSSNPYEEEARQRWGDAAVDQSSAALASMSGEEQQNMQHRMNDVFARLAQVRHEAPGSKNAQEAVAGLDDFFNSGVFGVTYSPEAFAGLGRMYVDDPRFTKNIDQFGEGLSAFLAEAMAIYADGLK